MGKQVIAKMPINTVKLNIANILISFGDATFPLVQVDRQFFENKDTASLTNVNLFTSSSWGNIRGTMQPSSSSTPTPQQPTVPTTETIEPKPTSQKRKKPSTPIVRRESSKRNRKMPNSLQDFILT
jgi:hypothetical protein